MTTGTLRLSRGLQPQPAVITFLQCAMLWYVGTLRKMQAECGAVIPVSPPFYQKASLLLALSSSVTPTACCRRIWAEQWGLRASSAFAEGLLVCAALAGNWLRNIRIVQTLWGASADGLRLTGSD